MSWFTVNNTTMRPQIFQVASKGLVVKPLLSKDLKCRGQVDLVDMQSLPDGDYKFIMHYQEHVTKFSVLKALTSKRAAEVGYQLLDILLNCTNFKPTFQEKLLFSLIQIISMSLMSALISFYTPLRL
jgi:hypothetical protein